MASSGITCILNFIKIGPRSLKLEGRHTHSMMNLKTEQHKHSHRASYETRRFITVITTARQRYLFLARWIQSTLPKPVSLISILILSSHLRLSLSSVFSFMLSNKHFELTASTQQVGTGWRHDADLVCFDAPMNRPCQSSVSDRRYGTEVEAQG
jgi:hypothetical protein